jgi:hypothetical protein
MTLGFQRVEKLPRPYLSTMGALFGARVASRLWIIYLGNPNVASSFWHKRPIFSTTIFGGGSKNHGFLK